MNVAFPLPEWPRDLLGQGPPEDRTILLRGDVMIGRTRFAVTAVRVDPIQLGPDFRQDLHLSVYREYHLSTLIDILSELVDIDDSATIRLGTGNYLLWMVPAEHDH